MPQGHEYAGGGGRPQGCHIRHDKERQSLHVQLLVVGGEEVKLDRQSCNINNNAASISGSRGTTTTTGGDRATAHR